MRVLITGGTGFVGQALARRLADDGHDLRLLSRSGARTGNLVGDRVEYVRGTVTDGASIEAAASSCDALVHLAAREDVPLLASGDRYADRMFEVNVLGTHAVLAAARAAGVGRSVVVTSCTTFGHAGDGIANDGTLPHSVGRLDSVYVWSRVHQEHVCLQAAAAGQHVVIVAPTVIVGPDDAKGSAAAIDAFCRGRLPVVPPGGYNFIAIEDVVEGLVAALERGAAGARYLFAHENLTFKELFTRVSRMAGRPSPRELPGWATRPIHTVSDLLATFVRARLSFRGIDALLIERYFFDASVAIEELGLPQTSIDDAIARTIASLSHRGDARQPQL